LASCSKTTRRKKGILVTITDIITDIITDVITDGITDGITDIITDVITDVITEITYIGTNGGDRFLVFCFGPGYEAE
jgi:hypothetical protein